MLYKEIMAVCSQIHTKHINTLCGKNVELLNVKPAVHIGFSVFTMVVLYMTLCLPPNLHTNHQDVRPSNVFTHSQIVPQSLHLSPY